jgi:Kdo2-lipid IVA lauroyltransferase/acyltransferase
MPIVKIISRLLAALPRAAALRFGRFCGWIFGSLVRHHRRDALAALSRSFPELSRGEILRIADRMYANLGMSAIETLRLPYSSVAEIERIVEWKGLEHVERALEQGRGVLVLTAHLDNWELFSILAPRFFPTRCYVIAKDIKSRFGQHYVDWNRKVFGLNILPAKKSYRLCLRALKDNAVIGFVIDQNMIRREGEFVQFFGQPACTTLGLAHLAARTGAPVLPAIPVRKPGGLHEITILPPLDPPAGSEQAALIAATQRYTDVIESAIREHPDQWIWIHRRWKTTDKDVC